MFLLSSPVKAEAIMSATSTAPAICPRLADCAYLTRRTKWMSILSHNMLIKTLLLSTNNGIQRCEQLLLRVNKKAWCSTVASNEVAQDEANSLPSGMRFDTAFCYIKHLLEVKMAFGKDL